MLPSGFTTVTPDVAPPPRPTGRPRRHGYRSIAERAKIDAEQAVENAQLLLPGLLPEQGEDISTAQPNSTTEHPPEDVCEEVVADDPIAELL